MSLGAILGVFFGWRKALKCKKLIKRVQSRIKLLRDKRSVIAKQTREDIGLLLKSGHEQVALGRIEQLYKDENALAVYEQLDQFCDFILLNLAYIRRNKDCPNNINEAVSSLIFASARCGELPELRMIRKLFGERYGQRFAISAVELLPGNMVNYQIKERLVLKPVSEDVKQNLLEEIIKDYFFPNGQLALKYKPSGQPLDSQEPGEALPLEAATTPTRNNNLLCLPYGRDQEPDIISICPMPMRFSPDPNKNALAMVRSLQLSPPYKSKGYQDDVDEFRSPLKEGIHCQDQRVFVFKPPLESMRAPRRTRGSTRKRLRKRAVYADNELSRGIPFRSYDPEPCDCCCCRFRESRLCAYNQGNITSCSLNSPCYFSTNDDDQDYGRLIWKRRRAIARKLEYQYPGQNYRHMVQCFSFQAREKIVELDYATPLQDIYSKTSLQDEQIAYMGSLATEQAAYRPTYTRAITVIPQHHTGNGNADIARSKTFPADETSLKVQRPSSTVPTSPSHVHPKLPDYDELAAKFEALKEMYRQNNQHRGIPTSSG